MILIYILLVHLIFLILSDFYIKNSPKSKLNLVPINDKSKKKDGLNELIIDLKITNKSKTKELQFYFFILMIVLIVKLWLR